MLQTGSAAEKIKKYVTTSTPPAQGGAAAWSASIAHLGLLSCVKPRAGAIFQTDSDMTADQAIVHLRRKIAMQSSGGSHGLMRCWVLFRNRSGSTKDGITFAEFCRGLRSYGLPLPTAVSREIFTMMDQDGDEHIQIREFIDVVMGRWSPTNNTHFGGEHARRLVLSRRASIYLERETCFQSRADSSVDDRCVLW